VRAQRESRSIAVLLSPQRYIGWVVNATPRPPYCGERDLVLNAQEAGWARGPVWTGTEDLASTGLEPQAVQPVMSRALAT
jgi:hypothetical protein